MNACVGGLPGVPGGVPVEMESLGRVARVVGARGGVVARSVPDLWVFDMEQLLSEKARKLSLGCHVPLSSCVRAEPCWAKPFCVPLLSSLVQASGWRFGPSVFRRLFCQVVGRCVRLHRRGIEVRVRAEYVDLLLKMCSVADSCG